MKGHHEAETRPQPKSQRPELVHRTSGSDLNETSRPEERHQDTTRPLQGYAFRHLKSLRQLSQGTRGKSKTSPRFRSAKTIDLSISYRVRVLPPSRFAYQRVSLIFAPSVAHSYPHHETYPPLRLLRPNSRASVSLTAQGRREDGFRYTVHLMSLSSAATQMGNGRPLFRSTATDRCTWLAIARCTQCDPRRSGYRPQGSRLLPFDSVDAFQSAILVTIHDRVPPVDCGRLAPRCGQPAAEYIVGTRNNEHAMLINDADVKRQLKRIAETYSKQLTLEEAVRLWNELESLTVSAYIAGLRNAER